MVGHLDYFQFSTMINNIAMTIPMDKSLRIALFISLGSIPKAQSFLRLSIVFPNCLLERLYLFTSHQQCLRRPISPHLCSHLVLRNTILYLFNPGSNFWLKKLETAIYGEDSRLRIALSLFQQSPKGCGFLDLAEDPSLQISLPLSLVRKSLLGGRKQTG